MIKDFDKLEALDKVKVLSYAFCDVIDSKILSQKWILLGVQNITKKEERKMLDKPSMNYLPKTMQPYANGVNEGSRNNTIVQFIRLFKDGRLTEDECLKEVLIFNSRCLPPEKEEVVERTVKWFYAKNGSK